MEAQGTGLPVDDGQADAAQLGIFEQLAVLFPAMQCRQSVKFSLDLSIGADDGVRATHEPEAHDALELLGSFQPIGKM